MKSRLIVDSPIGLIDTPIEVISGWVLHETNQEKLVSFKINDINVRFSQYKRPDLDSRYGTGFSIYFSLNDFILSKNENLKLDMLISNRICGSHIFNISDKSRSLSFELQNHSKEKYEFISQNLNQKIRNVEGCNSLSALPPNWDLSPDISLKSDAPSAHFYDKDILDFVNKNSKDGFILDAGAGLRKNPHPKVINAEIYDYPSTDILCIGQNLPFKDNTFEAALSFAVLEHVDNPFQCANELVRVVKPGGKIYVIIPFLQAEHGYPSHYFNSTRFGMAKLFERCRKKKQWLNRSNNPIFTAHQILSTYSQILDSRLRNEFESLTIKQLIDLGDNAHKGIDNKFMNLIEDQAFKIAWGTTAIFEK
jgi:SAM-dependent methyltransferase